MYILKQTNLLKFGLITVGIIIALFCFYVIVGFLGIQFLMEPYQYGTFFAWVIILFSIFYRFTFLLLTIGVFFGIINVLEWHLIFAVLFTLPSLVFIFPKNSITYTLECFFLFIHLFLSWFLLENFLTTLQASHTL